MCILDFLFAIYSKIIKLNNDIFRKNYSMNLVGLTVALFFIIGYSWPLNTLFFNPSSFVSSIIETKHYTVAQNSNIEKLTPKKLNVKIIKPDTDNDEIQEQEKDIFVKENDDYQEELIEKNEPDTTDSFLTGDYEDIIFSDVFDSWYREKN